MIELFAVALFLPLFPLSIVLNGLLSRLKTPWARFMILLLWPQIGVLVLHAVGQPVQEGFVAWALLSSAFYALRLLTVRDLGLWAGFLASSALALAWVDYGDNALAMHILVFWLSLPSALLALLAGSLVKRFGAAYAGLHGSLAGSVPRLSALLVIALLAAIATPPFPGFFAILGLLHMTSASPAILFIWLLWGWAAVKLVQGFLSGENRLDSVEDIGRGNTLLFTFVFGAMVFTGLFLTRGVL